MAVIIRGQYAGLSRGKHCAKHVKTGRWADLDDNGDLVLDEPGRWMVHTSDGFNRKETEYVTLDENCELTGSIGRRFSVV